ncbi:GNAT family N-acetyltransferase [uncultured Algimonas sp.]|uniref:GNAT family N-acetyltransferase n=1 Tax=uncultured Algimonas sp. TaxID=1547920 RepID=UPI002617C3DF|nr:GNAT family N-acetyltransferase [uncultured Algimonas sp.]
MSGTVTIILTHDRDTRVQRLTAVHETFCAAHTPTGSGHALSAEKPDRADEQGPVFWLALQDDRPVGCIGLRTLSEGRAELKTLHVLEEARGGGIAAQLLQHCVAAARADGVQHLLLETGRSDGFAASQRFYARHGFAACEPYGPYVGDPFSYCMARLL